MKTYYSSESAHGSETSQGFCNDTVVKAFSSKLHRDTYVAQSKNITCKAIPASRATHEATNRSLTSNRNNAPRPFTAEFWAIMPPYDDDDTPGFLGYVDSASEHDAIVRRFHG